MFNIKKQIKLLYASSIMGQISLSAAWVAILAARGFSLAQIGLAEMIFHIVSFLQKSHLAFLQMFLEERKLL